MEPIVLLACYSAALFGISLAGGALPQRFTMTHTRTQLAMSLVSGLMLGIAFFHLLPHAVLALETGPGLSVAMAWVVLGLVVMLLLLRMLHFHQPDYPMEESDCDHAHSHGHGSEVHHANASWRSVLIGLSFHTLIDGIALGAAFLAAPHGHSEELLAFGVFLAILLHKPLDAMSITALMKAGGTPERARQRANLLFAVVCPVGALAFYAYGSSLGEGSATFVAPALAFSAGAFICIALSDLLPEVQFHSHDRLKLTAVFLLGIVVSYLLAGVGKGHSHGAVLAAVSAIQ